MKRLRTTPDKARHQVKRGRRTVTARQFNQAVRDHLFCACIGMCQAALGCPVGRKS